MLIIRVYCFLDVSNFLLANDFSSHSGFVSFFGEKTFTYIRADYHEVESTIDTKTGKIEFHAIVKSFHFKIKLMKKKFKKKFTESDRYPKVQFIRKNMNPAGIDFNKPGEYKIMVGSNLTIHNVTG